jgi:hypothetical protein
MAVMIANFFMAPNFIAVSLLNEMQILCQKRLSNDIAPLPYIM